MFPEIYSALNTSVLGRALSESSLAVNVVNIRDYSKDKHQRCDDTPFGGGAGMVMTPQPLHDAITANDVDHCYHRIYLSPKGHKLDQKTVLKLSKLSHIMLVNGSYEGIDERIIDLDIDEELSIGDFVLTSGDFASLVVINAIARYIPGVLGSEISTEEESFSEGLLEYPHYTRPRVFMDLPVPDVLLSGDHKKIYEWRKSESLKLTLARRPDLLNSTDKLEV